MVKIKMTKILYVFMLLLVSSTSTACVDVIQQDNIVTPVYVDELCGSITTVNQEAVSLNSAFLVYNEEIEEGDSVILTYAGNVEYPMGSKLVNYRISQVKNGFFEIALDSRSYQGKAGTRYFTIPGRNVFNFVVIKRCD